MDPLEGFLRTQVGAHPQDLAEYTASQLSLPLSTVEDRIQHLVRAGVFEERLAGGKRLLAWKPIFRSRVHPEIREDRVWRESVAPHVQGIPDNVRAILRYGTTEMLNNVVDHSGAKEVVVVLRRLPEEIEIHVEDDGVGIFKKLQRDKELEDPRHVALELAKGKLTTDPARHTGEGIFFTARMCDRFLLWSGTTVCGLAEQGSWHVKSAEERPGTTVRMAVRLDSTRTPKEVFDQFAPPERELAFTQTALQVDLARQDGDELISRSQAKRLLERCEHFREITLDFQGIETIGPAFADEVFRVFPSLHPGLSIRYTNAGADVRRMIERARQAGASGTPT